MNLYTAKSSKTNLCRNQVASALQVSHVEHYAIRTGQPFSAGQFHNCIFTIKYYSPSLTSNNCHKPFHTKWRLLFIQYILFIRNRIPQIVIGLKKLLLFTNSLTELLSDSFFNSLLSDSSIRQSHSKLQFNSLIAFKLSV